MENIRVINKKWGKEKWIKVTDNYAFKILEISRGCSTSLHYHKYKEETWYVIEGLGIAQVNNRIIRIEEGDFIHIKPKVCHRLSAIENLKIAEVSTSELWDVVRVMK